MGVRTLLGKDPKSQLFNVGTRTHVPWSAESLQERRLQISKYSVKTFGSADALCANLLLKCTKN